VAARTPLHRRQRGRRWRHLTLNSKQLLASTSDAQIQALTAGGVPAREMPAWCLDFVGTLTDEQVKRIVTYLRSLAHNAPNIPDWRSGATVSRYSRFAGVGQRQPPPPRWQGPNTDL
jgi:hypothetical protein